MGAYGWWLVTYVRPLAEAERHLVPEGDLRHHTGPGCWCEPVEDDEAGVWCHHALDQREAYEQRQRALN